MGKFNIKFWGIRGSYPTPGDKFIKYGGNTTCLEIETEHSVLIFDAGTGIINLGKKLINEDKFKNINLFFTHTHKDHTEGFSSFIPAYSGKYRINIYGAKFFDLGIKEVISNSMTYTSFPISFDEMSSLKFAVDIMETDIIIKKVENDLPIVYNKFHSNYTSNENDIVIKVLRGYNHPKNGIIVYRIEHLGKSVVFATDVESYSGTDKKLIEFSKNADILIHDAAYNEETYLKKQGWGHSTPRMAALNAKDANVNKLYLTHYDPEDTEDDIDQKLIEAKKIFKNSYLAYENLEVSLI
ncbi:MAG: MBL fold metallo-hydrolase [Fusobacteria bacterium]|jgi:ribonuclease BN (tRNA processing enzyme)|nr:MBL fold metallo-hydrolase [Fusobacteriota bacterium]